MKVTRRFTTEGRDVFTQFEWTRRTSRITNPDGSVVFEMKDAEVPAQWSQLATDIMVSKYFRKAGVPKNGARGSEFGVRGEEVARDPNAERRSPNSDQTGSETSVKQVVHRLAGCWRHWGETHGYFDSKEDAQVFYDEIVYMMLDQSCAPNSPQWFNTGLFWAYGITGPAQGHFYCDPKTGEMRISKNAYEHPQPHACFIQSVSDDLVNPGGIMDLWVREARLFKYGSGTGSNFSKMRGDNESLAGGGRSSGLMSFLKIGDRAAGAIKSGGTTRRAAKMVCLDLDHPDVEEFINWKVREEIKVAALVEGFKILPTDQKELAKKLGLKLDYDFNGESYLTVSGQNSNNSIRIPNEFLEAVENDGDWNLTYRTDGKVAKTIKARDLWDQISFAAWRCADPGVQFDTTINQWHTCPKSGRINASNPCVTGDTRVLTPGGIWRRIDSMIHLPARIVTNVDGKEIHVVDGAFPTGTKQVFELTTESGYRLKLTADHKVWTKNGWIDAKDLTSNDEVRLMNEPACVEEIGEPVDTSLFQLAGLLLSDANDSLTRIELDKCVNDSDRADQFATYYHETWNGIESDGAATLTKSITNRRLLSRIGAFYKIENGQKRLNDDAFTSGLAAQKHLLRGLFSADGIVTETSVELHNSSIGLIEDVQTLLLGFGIKTRRDAIKLTIDPTNLTKFARHIAFANEDKLARLASLISDNSNCSTEENWDRIASFTSLDTQSVFDLTEPFTSSFVANGITVHNCSEYMFLDDTACNLASLNLLRFFDSKTRKFDIDAYRHAIRLWTIVLEISVLMAGFPSEAIARLSYKFRTLGLGYANLGALLMQAGIPYDSDPGRAFAAAVTSILTGESYSTSAEMARELGAFEGFAQNKEDMLRVMRNHRRAAFNETIECYENLDIRPVSIDSRQFDAVDPLLNLELLKAARTCWNRAISLGEQHGYRNAQTTCIAPTGTIGLLMDCDTTGVEPDFALVKFKKLAGGGYFKIANQSVEPALHNLGYTEAQIRDILRYVLGTLNLKNSPHINHESLMSLGFTVNDIERIESSLPSMFELGFAFSPWTLGKEFFERIGISEAVWQSPGFNLLRRLGFKQKQIDEASEVVCGRGTVEGAPHLKSEHLAVFDCANKCGRHGVRYIAAEGHIRMMAAAQPFISGAISKTINLPNEATVDDIKEAYELSWKLGLKANALYRDGSKLSQPLNVKSDELDDVESEENVEAARADVLDDVVRAASIVDRRMTSASSVELSNVEAVRFGEDASTIHDPHSTIQSQTIIERIIERVVERPLRRRLPDTRQALTHKFDVAGHEGYITVGLYEDGTPGEVFITMSKEGSTIGGLMDTIATLVSVALQYGVPIESLVRKFEHVRFEPSGMTRNRDIPFAKSPVDYIFRWLAMEFLPGYRAVNAPAREPVEELASEPAFGDSGRDIKEADNGEKNTVNKLAASEKSASDESASLFDRSSRPSESNRISAIGTLDAISQQTRNMQSDAPPCATCGAITVRSGTCYKCLNCGSSMGCS